MHHIKVDKLQIDCIDLYYTHTHTCLLFQHHSVFLLHSFTLAVPAAQVRAQAGGHVGLRSAGLAATATQSPHLLLITADAVRAEKHTMDSIISHMERLRVVQSC